MWLLNSAWRVWNSDLRPGALQLRCERANGGFRCLQTTEGKRRFACWALSVLLRPPLASCSHVESEVGLLCWCWHADLFVSSLTILRSDALWNFRLKFRRPRSDLPSCQHVSLRKLTVSEKFEFCGIRWVWVVAKLVTGAGGNTCRNPTVQLRYCTSRIHKWSGF